MKGIFFECIGISATIIGAVIGAGFITGAEIVRFFSSSFLIPSIALLSILLAVFLFSLLWCGKNFGSVNSANLRVLGRLGSVFECVINFFSFVTLCGMCAGLDAVTASFFGIDERIPVLSPIILVASFFICRRGTGGIAKFNTVLVPVMVIAVCFASFGNFDMQTEYAGKSDIFSVMIYAGMNCFLSAPVIVDSGADKSRKAIVFAAVLSSAVISLCAFFIMSKISLGYGTDENLPLLSALKNVKFFYAAFSVITLFGIVTTLVSSHYPLVKLISNTHANRALNVILMVAAIAVSRFGFYNIVSYAYPVMGMVGLIYCIIFTAFAVRKLFFPYGKFFHKAYKRVHTHGKNA